MSILFGIRKPECGTVEDRELLALAHATGRWAPDGTFVRAKGRIGMGFQPYQTHHRSHLESQPAVDEFGNMVTLDGRIDNHKELCGLLGIEDPDAADSQIVLAVFKHWGEEGLSRIVGDWALALWSRSDRLLYLARDHAGMRTLYYQNLNGAIQWATYLETFSVGGSKLELDEIYAACYLSGETDHTHTPYKGISAVPPAHCVVLGEGQGAIRAHWSWVIDDRIRYKHDGEYEDHFRGLLIQAVKRRTAEKDAVLAELSGGMDSSSIVCVSDYIARQESEGSGELLDTVSYYDELESNWNERPYFTLVESRRGKVGVHLKTSFRDQDLSLDSFGYHSCWPGIYSTLSIREQQFEDAFGGNNYRVILSGVGGDEVLGGVPTALPELSDLVVKLRFTSFLERAVQYCLATRQPLLELVRTTIKHLYELYWKRGVSSNSPLWLNPRLAHHVSEVKIASAKRHPLRALPSTCGNVQMWWTLLATLPHRQPGFFARREYRYPYLDRDLVEYLMRVPRSQLARPGYRRSLMRRALRGIVPAEVLDRRRKASMITGPVVSLRHWEASICRSLDTSELKSLEFVEVEGFHKHLEMICRGTDVTGWPRIMQALSYECWLRATRRTSDEHQEHAQHVNFSVQVADVNELRA